jgi:hypothetical protein
MKYYQPDYFAEDIFATNYFSIAKAIADTYHPKKIIEFGCGPGFLTRELSQLNISVDAFDGFSSPDFKNFTNISFNKIDLNNEAEVMQFLKDKTYDVAICSEVAEHLDPESSAHLIKQLTSCAPVVIFSAAVPNQGGHGHINCQARGFWHDLFIANNFQVADTMRKELRDTDDLAIWYKLNLVDYVTNNLAININDTIKNLVESESYSSSLFYKMSNENSKNIAYLNYPLVKQYFMFRNAAKRLFKK